MAVAPLVMTWLRGGLLSQFKSKGAIKFSFHWSVETGFVPPPCILLSGHQWHILQVVNRPGPEAKHLSSCTAVE